MQAYHNNAAIKSERLAQVQAHHDADEIVKGKYWQNGKGCAVGCTIHSSNHTAYESELGIPEMLARLEDALFEGLPNEKAKEWPIRFLKAISVGADLSRVGYQFMYWNLTENLVLKNSDNSDVQKAIIQCRDAIKQCAEAICPLTKGEIFDTSAARSAARSAAESAESAASAAESAAESEAWSAAWSAESAAWSAVSAVSAASAESAGSAAWSAAESAAESAAWIAASAAWSAESAESAAEIAESAESAASAAYEKMANKLIKLIEAAV